MTDLIAAIATGPASGGVGIVRLSGPGAVAAAAQVFFAASGKALMTYPARQLVYGKLHDRDGRLLDHGMAVYFQAPHSYTGEEGAELHCHGSPMALALVLEALFAAGARQAQAGEFTRRAFLNGKLDLTQAEAVIDLIEAETPAAVSAAAYQLDGVLSRRVEEIYSGLVDLCAHFYAVLDYPDEDIDPFRRETMETALHAALTALDQLLQSARRGKQIKGGVPCVILGRPNVGKSSLLNALAGYARTIVTNLPGTTRDTVEERVLLGAVQLRLVDTAGLRETDDEVERLGVQRSREAAQGAALCLLVLDASQPLTREDHEAIALAQHVPQRICVLNKADLPAAFADEAVGEGFSAVCRLSAREGAGLLELEQAVGALFPQGDLLSGEALLSNVRQQAAAQQARDAILRALEGLRDGTPPDLLLIDTEEAMCALGELTGRQLREDITLRIFERFCVGK